MRWPLVSRESYEHVHRLLMRMTDMFEAERKRSDELLAKYHALAAPPSPTPTPASQIPHPEPSFVATIIRDQSKHDPRLAAYLKSYASQLKADGMTEDEIGMALTTWTTTEDLTS